MRKIDYRIYVLVIKDRAKMYRRKQKIDCRDKKHDYLKDETEEWKPEKKAASFVWIGKP